MDYGFSPYRGGRGENAFLFIFPHTLSYQAPTARGAFTKLRQELNARLVIRYLNIMCVSFILP